MTPSTGGVRAHADAGTFRHFGEPAAADYGTDDLGTHELERCARAGPLASTERLLELEHEWDTDRVIETEAAVMGLVGLALGAWRREMLVLPALVAANMLVHAGSGQYPLMPLLRRLGFRSAREIQRERHAHKALRGDYAPDDAPASASRGASDQASDPVGDAQRDLH